IDVIGRCVLERKADEFAAPLHARPVVELVSHNTAGLSLSSFGFLGPGGKCRARMAVTDWIASSAPASNWPALNERSIARQTASHSACFTREATPRSATIS